MKRLLVITSTAVLLLFISSPSYALWWMVYHKPAFKGKVIDAETKEPIEGAVVVVTYEKKVMRIAPHAMTEIADVRETLTDRGGNFYFPSYTTVVDPLAWEDMATFIIYKPGYGSFPNYSVTPLLGLNILSLDEIEFFFREEFYNTELDFWIDVDNDTQKRFKFIGGLIELPRLKTKEERLKSMGVYPVSDEFLEKQKNLIRLMNEEEENLGLQKSDPFKARESLRRMGR